MSLVLPQFEKIITQISSLTKIQFDLGLLVHYLEFWQQLHQNQTEIIYEEIKQQIQQFLASYDFLLLSLQSFWLQNKYNYQATGYNYNEQNIHSKFVDFCRQLDNLKQINWQLQKEKGLLDYLNQKIVALLQTLSLNPQQDYTFWFKKNQLQLSRSRSGFDLQKHFIGILARYPHLKIQTFLEEEDFQILLDICDLNHILEKTQVEYYSPFSQEYLAGIDLAEFFEQKLEIAIEQNSAVIILCGQNSGIKDSEKILISQFNHGQYLILGESGSSTKIASKLSRGFVGLVLLKNTDYLMLIRNLDLPKPAEIWFLGQPYLFVEDFWWQQANNYTDSGELILELKRLFLKSQMNQAQAQGSVLTGFIKSYH